MARNAGDLVSAPIRGCHAKLGVEGQSGHMQFTITDVRTHNLQMSVSGRDDDGAVSMVTFHVSSPLSQVNGMWVITTESGPLIIPRNCG